MIAQYKRRPAISDYVEAAEWMGEVDQDFSSWIFPYNAWSIDKVLYIDNGSSQLTANVHDMIIKEKDCSGFTIMSKEKFAQLYAEDRECF